MKKINIIIFLLVAIVCNGQNWDGDDVIDDPTKYSAPSPVVLNLKSSDEPKVLRVNVHYILEDDGSGNFAEDWDGVDRANNYNGYMHAQELIDRCNIALADNKEVILQPIPAVPASPINLSYQLSGVFFHRDSEQYVSGTIFKLNNLYRENIGDAINVFLTTWGGGGGIAFLDGEVAEVHGYYDNYLLYLETNVWFGIAKGFHGVVNHEIGHNLSLSHPTRLGCTTPCDGITIVEGCNTVGQFCDDDCDDTPTWEELNLRGISDPFCWSCSNNMMDYNKDQNALTPCQVEQIHGHIENFKTNLYSCFYQTELLVVNNAITENTSLIAQTVRFPNTISLSVADGNALYVNAEELEINGEFEVQLGGVFEVNITPACN